VENVGTVVDFGTLVRGQKRTLQASICNRCTPELKGVLNDGMIFDGVCQTFTAANVKAPDGTVIDLGDFDPIHVLQLLTIKIQKNECMTLDITYDSTKLPTIPAHLECEVGATSTMVIRTFGSSGDARSRALRTWLNPSVSHWLNCYVGSVCYASNLWNASNTCSTCKPGVSEGSNTMMTDWDGGPSVTMAIRRPTTIGAPTASATALLPMSLHSSPPS
jgi:ribosomal protein L40E